MAHANEKVASTHHEFIPAKPAADPLEKTGYVETPYVHRAYPKHVKNRAGEVFTVNSLAEELDFKAKDRAAE
jgi:hypothetical protein